MGGGGGGPFDLLGAAATGTAPDLGSLGGGTLGAPAPAPPREGEYTNLGGFVASGLASIPAMIGIGPERLPGIDAEALRNWEAQHEWLAFGASALSTLIPFTGGIRLGRMALEAVPATARLLGAVEANSLRALQTAPITTPVIRGMLELAPFEAARIGATAAVGDEDSLRNVAGAAAMDFGLAAGFGTVSGLYRAFRTRTEDEVMRGLIGPQYNGRAAPQERLGQLYDYRAGNPAAAPEALMMADNNILRVENEVRTQTPVTGEQYVNDLWNGANTREVRRLFNPAGETPGGITRQTLTVGKNGFETESGWRGVAADAGLPDGFLADVQYPRVVSGSTDAAAGRIRDSLNRNLRTARDGWRIEQEASTGMYVMGKEVRPGQFMLLKTANPNALLGEDIFQNTMNRLEGYARKVESPIRRGAMEQLQKSTPDSVYGNAQSMRNLATADLVREVERTGNIDNVLRLIPGRAGQLAKTAQDTASSLFQFTKTYLSPANFEFTGKPLAEATRIWIQNLVDVSKGKGKVLMRGSSELPEGQSWLASVIRPGPAGGFEGLVRDGLKEGDMSAIQNILRRDMNLEAARRELAGMDDLVQNGGAERINRTLTELDRIGAISDNELRDTEGLYGKPTHDPVDGHFGMPHLWRGEFRHRVVDDTGATIGVGSGRTAQEATANATKLSRQLEGRPHEDGAFRTKSFYDDEVLAKSAYGNANKRGAQVGRNTLDDRTAIFNGGDTSPLTKQDFLDLVASRLQSRYDRIPDIIVKNEGKHDILAARARYGDQVGDALQYRVDRMLGNKGEIDRWVNQKLQKLAPFLGNNAADKLVQGYNRLESISTLFSSVAYPVMNMMQPIQTLMPRIAWLRNANAGQLQDFFGFIPDIVNGKTRGFIGHLDPLLFVAKGIRAVTNPSPELKAMLARATEEGVIPAGFHQEFAGPGSHYGSGIRHALETRTTGGGTVRFLEQVLGWPARKVEELTRGHTFATAYEFLKAAGVRDANQLYYGAKQMTNKTSYQFTVADRSRVFNGPVGSAVGLFKNWSLNNLADWGTYAGSAIQHGQVAPLMWASAGNMALAGVGGLPLVAVADHIQKMFTNKPLMQHIYEAWRGPDGNNVADAIYFGLPTLLGVSLQSQLSAPMTDPSRDLNFMFNFSLLDRAHKLATLATHTFGSWQATGNPFSDPRTFDMLNYAIGPRILYRGLSEVQDGFLMSARNGRQYIGEIGPGQQLLNALGFTPTRIAQAYEYSGTVYANQTERRAATLRLGQAFARAAETNDQNTMTFITQRAIATGADLASVMRSAQSQIRLQHQPILPLDFRRDPQALELFGALGL